MTEPKLFVALDIDDRDEAVKIAEELSGLGLGFKLGPRLMLRDGEELVREVARHGAVFVDCKHFDIPSTMEAAIRTAFSAGATYSTIHTLAGPAALKKMAMVEAELNQKRHFRVLAVTVLTSFAQDTLPIHLKETDISKLVLKLAEESFASGIKSFVCSPDEAKLLRERLPESFLVTPGIRPEGSAKGDQVRVQTPRLAHASGSSALVVGRPILQATNRREAAQQILTDFSG